MSDVSNLGSGAVQTLAAIGRLLCDDARAVDGDAALLAEIVEQDPAWLNPECTRRHISLLFAGLCERVTAAIGSPLNRRLDSWDGDWSPRIVTATWDEQPDEFPEPHDGDHYGWLPLAAAHRREARWDFRASPEDGTWLGWWEVEAVWECEDYHFVTGTLTGYALIEDGSLVYTHVVTTRRRQGIATRLIEHAKHHYGLTTARGPFTADGAALVAATGLEHD